jgi:hypothetical protein
MLGLNLVRVLLGVAVGWFSMVLGTATLVAGGGALVGVHMEVFVLFFALAGVVTMGGALFRPKRTVAA